MFNEIAKRELEAVMWYARVIGKHTAKWMAFFRLCRKHASPPNIITVIRGLAVPVLVAIILIGGIVNAITFWLLMGAFAGDGVDGFIARLLNMVTREGAALDRGMDKVDFFLTLPIVIAVFYALLAGFSIGLILLVVFLVINLTALESLLAAMGMWGLKKGLSVESTVWGKAKMVFEYIFMGWMIFVIHGYQPYLQPVFDLFDFPLSGRNCLWVALFLLGMSNFLAICSIRGYWIKYAPVLRPYLTPLVLRFRLFLGQIFFRISTIM